MTQRRSGLGRGLDALVPAARSDQAASGSLREVPIDALEANPRQPREGFDPEQMAEMAESVRVLGILQPLLVRPAPGGRFQLIAGERRWRAARAAGLDVVPVLIVETDDTGSLERALVENLHREDLNPIEEAAAYKQLLEEGGFTHEELGARLGRNRATITNSLRLLDLPPDIQRLLIDKKMTAAHGRLLLSLQGNPFMTRLARRIAGEGLSVREAEDVARRYATVAARRRAEPGEAQRSAQLVEAQRRLADHLQTRVRVEMGKRKGRVVLDFVSLEELDRLVATVVGEGERAPRETRVGV